MYYENPKKGFLCYLFFLTVKDQELCVCLYAARPTVKFSLYILDKSTLRPLSFSFKVIQGNPPRRMWGPWVGVI